MWPSQTRKRRAGEGQAGGTETALKDISDLNEPRSSQPRKRRLSKSQPTGRDSPGRPNAEGDPGTVGERIKDLLRAIGQRRREGRVATTASSCGERKEKDA